MQTFIPQKSTPTEVVIRWCNSRKSTRCLCFHDRLNLCAFELLSHNHARAACAMSINNMPGILYHTCCVDTVYFGITNVGMPRTSRSFVICHASCRIGNFLSSDISGTEYMCSTYSSTSLSCVRACGRACGRACVRACVRRELGYFTHLQCANIRTPPVCEYAALNAALHNN